MNTDIPNTEEWNAAVRFFRKFCPESTSFINEPKDLILDTFYSLTFNQCFKIKYGNYDHGRSEKIILEESVSKESLESEGRVIAIHDLGDFYVKPIICAAKKLIQRVSEGIDNKHYKPCHFIGGNDTLFLFETTGQMILLNHDNESIIFNRKANDINRYK